jgi:hypothetical protein
MQTRAGITYGPSRRSSRAGGSPLKPSYAPSASGQFIGRFDKGTAVRTAFLVLHVLGFLAHTAGVLVVLFCTEIDAELHLWRLQPEYTTTFKRNYIAMKAEPDATLKPAWIAFVWFFCSALFHAVVLTSWACGTIESWYFYGLADNVGFWRWLEYSASASIMLLGASSMLGTRETRVVVASTVSMGVTMFFGYLTEKNASRHIDHGKGLPLKWDSPFFKGDWNVFDRFLPHLLGYVPFALSWWLALDSYYLATDAYTSSGAIVPDAGEALWAGFGLFMLFGSVQFLLLAFDQGPHYYWVGEMAYVILSVAAKFTMAMLLVFRGLTPERVAQGASVAVQAA